MKIKYLIFFLIFNFCFSNDIFNNIQKIIKNECGYGQVYEAADRSKFNDNIGKKTNCPFCDQLSQNQDDKYYILKKTKHSFVCLNYYPYMKGHLLVLPQRHIDDLDDLSDEEFIDLNLLIKESVKNLKKWKARAVNIGANLGKLAGASLPGHIHFHVLPRFNYNINFAFLLSNIIVVDMPLDKVFEELKVFFRS